jgi:hypothetical protein
MKTRQVQATAVARATLTAAEVGSWLAPGRAQSGAVKHFPRDEVGQ